MEQEEYEKNHRKRLSRMIQKETGEKYTTILRRVEGMSLPEVLEEIHRRKQVAIG